MLKSDVAKNLYHEHAEVMPIINCHITPMEIYEDKGYDSIAQVWLGGDNPMDIYEKCNAILAQSNMSVRGIIRKSGIKLICTTSLLTS